MPLGLKGEGSAARRNVGRGGLGRATGALEQMAGAPELFETCFFDGGQLARFTIFHSEDVPGRPFRNGTFGGFEKIPVVMPAAAMGPTLRPGSFIIHILRGLETHLKQHSVEGSGCLEVENRTQHRFYAGGRGFRPGYQT
jgi:hypothetical protein